MKTNKEENRVHKGLDFFCSRVQYSEIQFTSLIKILFKINFMLVKMLVNGSNWIYEESSTNITLTERATSCSLA